MSAIYKGQDVYVEVRVPKAFSAYTSRKAHLIFPAKSGALELKTAAAGIDGTAVVTDPATAGQSMPIVIFKIDDALTKVADDAPEATKKLLSNTSGYLEVRLTEATSNDVVILTVPLGPVIDTTIKSL